MVSRRRQTWRDKKQYRILPSRAGIMDLLERAPAGLFLPPAPSAPYTAEPPIDAPRFDYNMEGYGRYSPMDLDLSPIDNVSMPAPTPPSPYAVNMPPPPTVTDITGLPVAAPEAAPAPVAPPAGDIGWPMSDEEIRRAATGIRGAAPTPAAPTPVPEEQWLIDEKKKIAEIRRRASAIAPQYADYGQPIPEAEFLWSETTTPEYEATRREALKTLAPIHEARRTAIKERFAEKRARRRERQLARGAPPTWSERAEHETRLAELGRTYPPAEKLTAPEPETEKDLLDAMFNIQKTMANLDKDSPEYQIQTAIFAEIQNRLAAMSGGSIVEQPTPFVDRQWPRRNIPAGAGTERRFVPSRERDVKLQSAPDIQLDPYWDKLDDDSKQQLWQIYEDPEKLKIALQRLQQTYGNVR